MPNTPRTIELNIENIKLYNIYTTDGIYYLKPKRKYDWFICKTCNKEFIRYKGENLEYCSNRCSNQKIIENQRLNINDIKKSFEIEEYILLTTEYKNNLQKLDFICPLGHKHNITWSNWSNKNHKQRCGECYKIKGWSKPEREISEYIKEHYSGKIIKNDRTIIKNNLTSWNLELDVWLPEINKAIEYNGTYWHSIEYAKLKDNMKKEQCIQKGIDLLVIDDKDWYNDKLGCLNKINELIGI